MPVYRFHIDSPLAKQPVLLRISVLVGETPGFWQSIGEMLSFGGRPRGRPPFVGTVEGDEFRIYRDISYSNSFLPQIRGSVVSTPDGTRIVIAMFLHPIVAAFMMVWLGACGVFAAAGFALQGLSSVAGLVPAGMFLFGVALMFSGFFLEAFKARRLLEKGIGGHDASDQA